MKMRTSGTAVTPSYSIIIPEDTVARAADYLQALRVSRAQPGALLHDRLQGADLRAMTEEDLLGELLDTKLPQIFAESAVAGDGSDWSPTELNLLGDVSIAVSVTIFDDGNHSAPTPHVPPFSGMLIFTPSALLRNGRGHTPADWNETTSLDGQLSTEGYYTLYRRRLLPVFRYMNHRAAKPRSAFLTVPGLGCGQFAGPFRGQLGARLQAVLDRFLTEYGASFPNLKAIYFDPYSECENARREIHGISLMVRSLRVPGNEGKSQLCRPFAYAEEGDTFRTAHCTASLPGTTSPGLATTSSSAPAPPTTVSRPPRPVPCPCLRALRGSTTAYVGSTSRPGPIATGRRWSKTGSARGTSDCGTRWPCGGRLGQSRYVVRIEDKKLGDIVELNYGKALKKEDRRDGEYPVFGSSGIVGTHDVALVKGPGIIIGRKGNVGSVFWCNDDFFVIDTAYFVTSSLPLRFLLYVLPTLNFINSDAAVPGLRNQAYTLELIVPLASLLEKFCELAGTFERQAATLQRQIQNLRRTRDLLLPRLLSGQIEVEAQWTTAPTKP